MKVIFILLILSIGNPIINATSTTYSAIWYQEYKMATNTDEDYHILGQKYASYADPHPFSFVALPPTGYNYIVLHKRSSDTNDVTKKLYYNNLSSHEYLSYYFPSHETVEHDLNYIVWGFKINCTGFLTYKIKFFSSEAQLNTFKTALLAVGSPSHVLFKIVGSALNGVYNSSKAITTTTYEVNSLENLKEIFTSTKNLNLKSNLECTETVFPNKIIFNSE